MNMSTVIIKGTVALALMCISLVCQGEENADQAKTIFNMAKCMLKKTGTMCAFEELLNTAPSEPIQKDVEVSGNTNRYFVKVPSDDWRILWPGEKRAIDLELIHKSGHATVMVSWHEGEVDTYEKHAREFIEPLAAKLETEPENIPLDVWPYNEGGVFYALCYLTNIKTEECFYSASANMPDGVVTISSIAEYNDLVSDEIIQITASIDSP